MKYCKDCTEYSCGAQGSDNISENCGDRGTYFYRPEKEDKRTMQIDVAPMQTDIILNDILNEIDLLRDALMSTRVPPDVALQYKNTAYGLDYAECIIIKYKSNAVNNKKED